MMNRYPTQTDLAGFPIMHFHCIPLISPMTVSGHEHWLQCVSSAPHKTACRRCDMTEWVLTTRLTASTNRLLKSQAVSTDR